LCSTHCFTRPQLYAPVGDIASRNNRCNSVRSASDSSATAVSALPTSTPIPTSAASQSTLPARSRSRRKDGSSPLSVDPISTAGTSATVAGPAVVCAGVFGIRDTAIAKTTALIAAATPHDQRPMPNQDRAVLASLATASLTRAEK